MRRTNADWGWLVASLTLFGLLLFKHLSFPLLWQDEAETAVFATRIAEYGFPKVHGPRNVVYEFGTHAALGIDEGTDAYIGTTWGHFYFAVPGVLWAAQTDDLYARTFRVRLPFALAGAAGLALIVLAVTPTFLGDRPKALRFAACFFALSAASVSLLLHLREARYYSLLIFVMGLIGFVHFRRVVYGKMSERAYALAIVASMVLLFNVFYSAFFAMGLLLGFDACWRELRVRRGQPSPVLRLARALAPLAASLLLVAPELVFFETFQIAAAFSEHLGLTLAGYLDNLRHLFGHLTKHELLVPVLVTRLCLFAAQRSAFAPLASWQEQASCISNRLLVFGVGFACIGCLNPLVYERYFIMLGPVLTLIFLLDGFRLLDWIHTKQPGMYRTGVVLVVLLATLAPVGRIADLRGRWQEIVEPYRGPLDYAIPWIREHYADPEQLVIATNYENHPYMYYLGSHVIVGLSRSNIRRDRMLEPDVVIPRRRWRSSLPDAIAFLDQGDFEEIRFEVRDLHYNNVPALSRSASTPDPHRFETALAESDEQQFRLFARKRTGQGTRQEVQ